MYLIKVEHSFDSAHFLANYNGKCKNIHGHRWRVEAEVSAEDVMQGGEFRGMVIDFSDLKSDLKELLDGYDHSLIIEEGSLKQETYDCLVAEGFKIINVSFRTTAENFAKYFYNCLKEKGHSIKRVTVYETPTNSAAYEE